jgi:hypothetical protein
VSAKRAIARISAGGVKAAAGLFAPRYRVWNGARAGGRLVKSPVPKVGFASLLRAIRAPFPGVYPCAVPALPSRAAGPSRRSARPFCGAVT